MALLATPLSSERLMAAQNPVSEELEEPSPIEEALNLVRTLAENSASGLEADADAILRQSISQAELASRLRAALERAAEKSRDSMEALRLAVCAFTLALRDEGITPEAVLISLKAAIHSETFGRINQASTWNGPRLQETVTTWCIQDYYRDQDCAP
jgi:hypothetical protein